MRLKSEQPRHIILSYIELLAGLLYEMDKIIIHDGIWYNIWKLVLYMYACDYVKIVSYVESK